MEKEQGYFLMIFDENNKLVEERMFDTLEEKNHFIDEYKRHHVLKGNL